MMVHRSREGRPISRRLECRSSMPSRRELDFATTVDWLTSEALRVGGRPTGPTAHRCHPKNASALSGRADDHTDSSCA